MTSIKDLLNKIAVLIVNPLIFLGFIVATIYLFYGIAKLVWNADGKDLEENKRNVMFGVIGMFIMFSVYGILKLTLDTFHIEYWPF
jgi:hypothetical protein